MTGENLSWENLGRVLQGGLARAVDGEINAHYGQPEPDRTHTITRQGDSVPAGTPQTGGVAAVVGNLPPMAWAGIGLAVAGIAYLAVK